jgi:hypothetical protein
METSMNFHFSSLLEINHSDVFKSFEKFARENVAYELVKRTQGKAAEVDQSHGERKLNNWK